MKKGKNFQQQPVDELHFPITFWDERSVAIRYKEGEALQKVLNEPGEVKIFPVSSPPLMREILAEDESCSIMGRIFILSHTGAAANTVYKMREIQVPRQAALPRNPITQAEEEEEEEAEEEQPAASGPHPRKEEPTPAKKPRAKKAALVEKTEEQKSTEFKEKVAKRAAKVKAEDVQLPPPTENEETWDGEDEEVK